MNLIAKGIVLGCAATLLGAAAARAQDDESEDFDRSPERCIRMSRVDRTEVLDEQTILFYMYGGRIYRNHLPEVCRGLSDRDPFMISDRTFGREVCANDMIDLLQGFGSGMTRGRSCRLGQFFPTTAEEVEEIKAMPGRSGISVQPAPGPADAPAEGRTDPAGGPEPATGIDAGAESGSDPGSEFGIEPGIDTGIDTGTDPGAESGPAAEPIPTEM